MTSSLSPVRELWVCFELPPDELPVDAVMLSFLTPEAEEEAGARWGARLLRARTIVADVRDEARAKYLDLVARIGATRLGGRTLREALRGPDGVSRWWYLKTSEKNSLWGEDVYPPFLQLMCIKRVAELRGARRLKLFGAPKDFEAALAGVFEVSSTGAVARRGLLRNVTRALAARAASMIFLLRASRMLKTLGARAPERLDVLLEAHWDWSLQPGGDGRLRDRYFADLPDRLRRRGLGVGWLTCCEPDTAVWQRGRSLRSVVVGAGRYPEVVLAERYLAPLDIFRATLDPRYLIAFLSFARRPGFRELLRIDGLDLYPMLRRQIIELLAGPSVCRWELLATATSRIVAALRPRMILAFLELFLHSRAIYAGVRRASSGVKLWTAQHASYCRDKTFGLMDPERELRGEPDGCSVPAPDGLFVMGVLSRDIWRGNGYPADRVIVTGGLRYLNVGIEERRGPPQRPAVVLLAASMISDAELDLCDAVLSAAWKLPVRIRLREHPYACLSERREFDRFRDRITITNGTMTEDLDGADLVLFTHSGLSEEALVRGLPVWQWLGSSVNTSVFLDLPGVVPAFTSVRELRRALESFVADPKAWRPRREVQEEIVRQCFGPDPAGASAAISERISEMIRADVTTV